MMWLGLLAIGLALIGARPMSTQAQSGNLLSNPGMEQHSGNKIADGWVRWFNPIRKPSDASGLQYALEPVYTIETNPTGKYPELLHGGAASEHVGLQYDPWIGGIKQVVIAPANTQLRFCAWSRLYAGNRAYGKGDPSVSSLSGNSRVGIFPNGDGDWSSADVQWGAAINPHDTWQQACVTATSGPQGKVSVFTSNDYRGSAAIHLDAWWDDAELVALGEAPSPTPTAGNPPPPQPTTPPQPVPTAITNPDGSLVHTVVSGDTLFGLAFQYDVPIDQIYTLNGLNKDSILSIGQKIIIKAGTGGTPAQPTAAPTTEPGQPTATPSTSAPTESAATPTPVQVAATTAKLCVQAFNDANADGLMSSSEEAVSGVQFAVANAQGVQAASYTTDGNAQPHCFTDLPPGSYTVAVQPAPSTVATSDKRWGVALTGGSTVNINFGSRSEGEASGGTNQPGSSQTGSGSNLTGLLAGAGGLILLLVAGVLGAFIIARRRA
jgi:hypothetical protein